VLISNHSESINDFLSVLNGGRTGTAARGDLELTWLKLSDSVIPL
jgi:hypothetical protein